MPQLPPKLQAIVALTRLDRPIGTYLLLWPTWCALWLAAQGLPALKLLAIFSAGVLLMRSAGCAINDYADRHFDPHVERTRQRPLATGALSPREALAVFAALCAAAFALVLFTNALTVALSLAAVALAATYPFMKRHTHLPQVVLGAAYSWAVPMAFAAQTGAVPAASWLFYLGVVAWVVAYDTFYAMVDRSDDVLIGVKSTAVLFDRHDRLATALLQLLALALWSAAGWAFALGAAFWLGLALCAGLFGYQQWLIRHRERDACFRAFLHNRWVGAALWAGIASHYALA